MLARHCGEMMFFFCSRRGTGVTQDLVEKECQTACKPGSVPAPRGAMDDHSSGTSVAGRLARPTRTAAAKTPPGRTGSGPAGRPSLFGLAPGGVCRAAAVTGGAVRSYRTLSPLPAAAFRERAPAVCSLWHFPWGRPRRALPGTVFPWSPDFPPLGRRRAKSGHPAVWRLLARRLRASRQPSRHGAAARPAGPPSPRPAGRRSAPGGSGAGRPGARRWSPHRGCRWRRPRSRSVAAPAGSTPGRRVRRPASGQRPMPAAASAFQSNSSPGSILRVGATSEWPSTRDGRDRMAGEDRRGPARSSAAICGSGKAR